MDWIESVKTYIRVVEEGSFNQAARRLNTTTSAVSKRIHFLEERIGVQLLKRTTRSLSQTEAGAMFYHRGKAQVEQWQSLVDETRSINQTPTGLLRVGATLALGSKFFMRYVDDFLHQYPHIKVQLITTLPGQLPELSFDIYIGREIENLDTLSFRAAPLIDYQSGFYAAPSYLKQYGEPQTIADLIHHNMLIWGEKVDREVRLTTLGERSKKVRLTGNFSTTNPEALFHSAKRGMGIILSNQVMLQEEIERGELVRILPNVTSDHTRVYAYYPKLDYEHTRTQLFVEYLKQRLESEKDVKVV
ncbi:LysR family transcriptional regulator [Vibrio algivorus]|uniref:LysR family transcriptional regulator n=1 Tax=Vibrio algivorus TaxID=1667024 RepID=A0A557P2P9_9VIBR|nr:LysR family transcriptional regulator [Vibrio algivorus]TVO34941.1 LysR family transcriptional regulator [Vibrio algivorus]GLT13447.1 LysR family transcriptional regulator [Vibrio algivorus]